MNTDETLRDLVLHTDDQLGDLLQVLLQRANQRQMWLLFIDPEGRLGEPLMPMDDYPRDPLKLTRVDDLGEVTEAHLLMQRIGLILEATGNTSVVLVWERVGSAGVNPQDRAWAQAMAERATGLGIPLRAQFVLHASGIRQLHPDDYL